ncbi:electron transport complex subunit RsxC, partial [Methylogaea oryzae]
MLGLFWEFHGGVRLNRHKELSSEQPLAVAPIPKQLIYPLQQRGGRNAEPLVAVGDTVLKGQVIAQDSHPLSAPIHAASSGVVTAIESRAIPHPSGLDDVCIVIDTDGEDRAVRFRSLKDFRRSKVPTLRQRIQDAGIVGMGGAAFPTSAKLNTGGRAIDLLVLNGAECEPYITCDDCLLRSWPERVLGGAAILMRVIGVERCIVAVEADMPEAAKALEAVRIRDGYEHVEIVKVPSKYPTGGEKQLIQVLTGREVPVRGIPADVGVVCQNVGTAAAVYAAVTEGKPLI